MRRPQNISYGAAKKQGLKRYFTGEPCKNGHVSERWVSTGGCLACLAQKNKEWSQRNLPKLAERQRRWNAANPNRTYLAGIKRRYGLDADLYQSMVAAQSGRCGICGDPPIAGRRLSVDHCHASGQVRGLLCDHCNQALGGFRDSPQSLRRAAEYLERHEMSYRRLLRDRLIADEGRVKHAYPDSEGFLTIGIGRLIDSRLGGGLSDAEIDMLLDNDIDRCEREVRSLVPGFDSLSDGRKVVVLSMLFQMGSERLAKFKNTLRAINEGRWADAAAGMRDSLWATQTPARALRLAQAMETGNLA